MTGGSESMWPSNIACYHNLRQGVVHRSAQGAAVCLCVHLQETPDLRCLQSAPDNALPPASLQQQLRPAMAVRPKVLQQQHHSQGL